MSTIPCEVEAQQYLFRGPKKTREEQHLARVRRGEEDPVIPCGGRCKIRRRMEQEGVKNLKLRRRSGPMGSIDPEFEKQLRLDKETEPFVHTWRSSTLSPTSSRDTRFLFAYGSIVYSPPHDWESLWWLLLYFVFVYVNTAVVEQAMKRDPTADLKHPSDDQDMSEILDDMFHGNQDARKAVLALDDNFLNCAAYLHESLWPVGEELEGLRIELVRCYIAAEEDREAYLNPVAWSGLHDSFVKAIHNINDHLSKLIAPDEDEVPESVKDDKPVVAVVEPITKAMESPINALVSPAEVDESLIANGTVDNSDASANTNTCTTSVDQSSVPAPKFSTESTKAGTVTEDVPPHATLKGPETTTDSGQGPVPTTHISTAEPSTATSLDIPSIGKGSEIVEPALALPVDTKSSSQYDGHKRKRTRDEDPESNGTVGQSSDEDPNSSVSPKRVHM